MKKFALLIRLLATGSKVNVKIKALEDYFNSAPEADRIWVIAIFSGRRPKRAMSTAMLREACIQITGTPVWLFEECYHTVGDLAETIALLLPKQTNFDENEKSLSWYLNQLHLLGSETDENKWAFVQHAWNNMSSDEIFVFNKLFTGGFRIGVSQKLMVNALAKATGQEPAVIAHRITGKWDPAISNWEELLYSSSNENDLSKPYPFYLAYAVETDPSELGNIHDWQAEWKWDGIRGQLIKRQDEFFIWSRGEELLTAQFPELHALAMQLPNGVAMDGELIVLNPNAAPKHIEPLPFSLLQTRISRKNISKKQLIEAPVSFIAYDLLEYDYKDIRDTTLRDRRSLLQQMIQELDHPLLKLSPVIEANNWDALALQRSDARQNGSEGIMIKKKDAVYQVGRKKGDWWKWKIDPLTIDAVLIYAQKGHGRRSNLYTDYTFAVSDGEKLVPFTKAYSGLTDKEFAAVDAFVKRNAIEKFGPVRTVKPELVFEIAFEGIAASKRHKSGVALRFPRMSRWRQDKKLADINSLEDLKKMLELYKNETTATEQPKK
jgi:DNA ligase-1